MFQQRQPSAEISCQLVLSQASSADFQFSGSNFRIDSGQGYDLLPLVRSAMANRQAVTAPLIANLDDVQIKWVIDALPCVRNLVAEIASDVNGLLQIEVEIRVASLFPMELQLLVGCGDEEPSVRRFWTDPGAGFGKKHFKCSMSVKRLEAAESCAEDSSHMWTRATPHFGRRYYGPGNLSFRW